MATCPACKGHYEASFCPRDGTRLIKDDVVLGDRYRLVRKVGEGAMGEVHEGIHVHLDRRVAVKLLQRKIASDPDASARLQREAKSTTGLGHPNIVDTIDFGFADGQAFLVMEWLDGETLDARMERGLLDLATALDIASQTCAGVGAAHDRGVIHRDLKPANLFLTRDHRGALLVKVLDFGIAKLALHETKLTATGVLIGTPNYMAPEQAEGNPIDARTDVYALGVILYEMLTGTVPFHGETPLAVLHQHTSRIPIVPSVRAPERGISTALDQLVMRCLAKRPDDRFGSMHELGAALAELRGMPVPAGPPGRTDTSTRSAVHAPQNAPAKISPPEEDDELPATSLGRRWILPIVLGGCLLAGAAVTVLALHRGSSAPPAHEAVIAVAVRDAGSPADAPRPVSTDAPPLDAAPDAPLPGLTFQLRGHHINGTLVVRPEMPIAGQSIELSVDLGALEPRLREALASGKLSATVEVEYYKTDTLVAPTATVSPDAAGRFTVAVPIAHPTKHHVHIDVLIDGKEVDHAKVDLWPELR